MGDDKKKRPARGTQTGDRAIRALFADAKRELEDEAQPDDPDPNLARDDIKPGKWPGFPHDRLPPNNPVHVIGRDTDGNVYCVNAGGLFRKVEKWDLATLADLYAPQLNYLMWAWPGWTQSKVDRETGDVIPPRVNRVERDKAMMALVNAASKRPLFDPAAQHRGRGGWKDKSGRFLWHSGSHIWTVDRNRLERARPAEHEGFLYTRQAATIEPWLEPIAREESPALRILKHLVTWNWERPYLDPLLCLGWIAVAIMGGALKVRPIIFTTGGAGVGKSTLHELFKLVLDGMVLTFADTTAAGIYQRVKQDSLPAMVDELENKQGSTRATAIIDLARIAYSGADMGRGGADHEAVSFKLQLAFLFSAINPPFMTDADRSRMAILNLSRLDQADALKMDLKDTDGRMLLRQIMDGWPEFSQRTLQRWWDTLKPQGLDSRAIDTFGTLLAAAEMLVGPEGLEETGLPITESTKLGWTIAAATRVERAERLDNWHKCLNWLLDSSIDAWRDGVRPTVGATLDKIGNGKTYPEGLELQEAQQRLYLVNLSARKAGDPGKGVCLAIPKDGPALEKLFAGTDFARGGWFTALKQAPRDVVIRDQEGKQTVKINGSSKYCLLVDMKAFADYVASLAEKEEGRP